jgi:hypothetical protein
VLESECFCKCRSLATVTFASDSKLSCVGGALFSECSSLSSICGPSSLQTILRGYHALLKATALA